jgi:excinuclease ABC subunit C
MHKKVEEKIKSSPHLPGVYIFLDNKKIIYIGKANDLNFRLKSYLNMRVRKNTFIAKEANDIKMIITANDIEALLLESKLIKEHQPKYNTVLKDGKNYFFVKISNHDFPKISITHDQLPIDGRTIGPFTSGSSLKELLKLLR